MIQSPGRILAIDYGSRWVGLAWSDPSFTIVADSRTLDLKGTHVSVEDLIKDLVGEIGVSHIVVGMPYNMNGSAGFKARETQEFIGKLSEKVSIPISHWDERLTTVRAEGELRKLGKGRKGRRQVDEMSATFILQDYLSSISSQEDKPATS